MVSKEIVLSISNLSKTFEGPLGTKKNLFEDINLSLVAGQFKSLLAPQGSGKTTLLRIIAGLEKANSGEVDITDTIPNPIKTAFIPSRPSSLPWLNVEKNIEYILNLISKNKDTKNIKELINIVGLTGYEKHYAHNKSVGFRFRISLARALAANPKIILIDEPLNNLDFESKKEIYHLLNDIHVKMDIAFLFATSNISEAVFLSDFILVLQKNPIKILKEIEVNLPPNRRIEIFQDELFDKIRSDVIQVYKSESDYSLHSLTI